LHDHEEHSIMHKYIIMGVQGCGKGTQAKLLKEAFDLVHISVGDIFRWHIQSHTKLGARIKRSVGPRRGLEPPRLRRPLYLRAQRQGDRLRLPGEGMTPAKPGWERSA
jgi:hypothetical protein